MSTFAAACITVAFVTLPPPEFDPYFQGMPSVIYQTIPADEEQLDAWCGPSIPGYDSQTQMIYGCTDTEAHIIYFLENLCGDAFNNLMRHELAHLRGWKHE